MTQPMIPKYRLILNGGPGSSVSYPSLQAALRRAREHVAAGGTAEISVLGGDGQYHPARTDLS